MTHPTSAVWRRRTLLLAALAWLAATAWLRPLSLPDEGRYVGIAWEMIRSGNWVVPKLDGLPYFHKPPLFYWITAVSLSLAPSSLLAARVAPWAGAAMACISTVLFARRWAGERRADATLIALVTAPIFYLGAQFSNLDMLVAGCITATILGFAHAALLEDSGGKRAPALLAAYAFCALGVLAKGLIGIVLPGMVVFLWLAWERRWRTLWRLLWLPGIGLFFLIAAPWFLAMQSRFPGFAHYFLVVQHFQRYAHGGFNNVAPLWFYPAVLALSALPWTVWLALGTRRSVWRQDPHLRPVRRLMVVWAAAITLFFSLPQSKLVGYIFPAVPPLMFLAADAAVAWGEAASRRGRALLLASATAAAAFCVIASGAAVWKADRAEEDVSRVLRDHVQDGDAVLLLDEYRFAIPFEARLRAPAVVVTDWSPQAVASRDNWRRELADAAQFAPAQDWLIEPAEALPRVCRSGTAWIVADSEAVPHYPWLAHAESVAMSKDLRLWKVSANPVSAFRQGLCRGTPNASSGGTS